MARLGQLLLARGWITQDQLQRALRNQRLVGGRLGTCLLEAGSLAEDLLVRALAEQHRRPACGLDDLRRIPDPVVALLAPRLAIRYQAVPFQALGGRVDVAVLDVRNLALQDELAFVLGKPINVFIAPEVRILEALAAHWGAPLSNRYARLLERLNQSAPPQLAGEAAAIFGDVALAPGTLGELRFLTPSDAAPPPAAPALAESAPLPEAPRATPVAEPDVDGLLDLPLHPATLPAGAARGPTAGRPEPEAGAPPEVPPGEAPANVQALRAVLAAATSLEGVARSAVGFLQHRFTRVLLFRVRRERVEGWLGAGTDVDAERLAALRIGLDQPSVFLNLNHGGRFFLGRLSPMPAHRALTRCWHADLPAQSFLLPVRIGDRLVAVAYADRGEELASTVDLAEIMDAAAEITAAFERCVVRAKRRTPLSATRGSG